MNDAELSLVVLNLEERSDHLFLNELLTALARKYSQGSFRRAFSDMIIMSLIHQSMTFEIVLAFSDYIDIVVGLYFVDGIQRHTINITVLTSVDLTSIEDMITKHATNANNVSI